MRPGARAVLALLLTAQACAQQEAPAPRATAGARDAGRRPPGWGADIPELARTTCQVTSVPGGAAIWVNGVATGLTTPAGVTLWAGRASRIEARLPGFLPAQATVEPALHQDTARELSLEPAMAVRVASSPPAARVTVDGRPAGVTPGVVEVSRGRHLLGFSLPGRMPVERTLVVDRPTAEVEVALAPAVTLRVKSIPRGAELFVDGRAAPARAPAALEVEAGVPHQLTAALPGSLPVTQRLPPVVEGQTDEVTLVLEEASAPQLKRCLGEALDRVRAQQVALQRLRRQLDRAPPAQRAGLAARVEGQERELAVRQVEADACSRRPEAP